MMRIILTGATGFVGRHVYAALEHLDAEVVCTTRDTNRARQRFPDKTWAELDVDDPVSVASVLRPGDRVIYLVHAMGQHADYARREELSAMSLARVAANSEVDRIIYLGGPEPEGTPSRHLASRLRTGKILRDGVVPAVELRAGMIMGPGSESWCITRDLSVRLPIMLLPRWLRNQCEPIAIDDVAAAIAHAVFAEPVPQGAWDLPGPDRLTYQEVLYEVARMRGTRPIGVPVPLLTPRLSSHWLRLVTRADFEVARELVDGLAYDLVSDGDGYFKKMPEHERVPFTVAAKKALEQEQELLSAGAAAVEKMLARVTRPAPT